MQSKTSDKLQIPVYENVLVTFSLTLPVSSSYFRSSLVRFVPKEGAQWKAS